VGAIGFAVQETPSVFWSVLLASLAILFIVNLVVHFVYARLALAYFEGSPPFHVVPSDPDPLAEPMEFRNRDGVTLRGVVVPQTESAPRGVLVFCPETLADFWSYQQYVPAARDAGFDIVSFDFRNEGLSDAQPGYAPNHWATTRELDDLTSVLDQLRSIPRYSQLPLVLHGVSRGGTVALQVAAQRDDVAGVIPQGAFACRPLSFHYSKKWLRTLLPRGYRFIPNWHIRVTKWMTRTMSERRRGCRLLHVDDHLPALSGKSLLWIGAERDSWVPPELTQSLFNLTGHPASDLWTAKKAKHNGERMAQPEEYDRRLIAFLNEVAESPEMPGRSDSLTPKVTNDARNVQSV
jgi:pimeloyl-ACP methyl ester carboxylesterase